MSRLALVLLVGTAALASYAASRTPACEVLVSPTVGLAPVRQLSIRAAIEARVKGTEARVALVDGFGPIRTSTLYDGADAAARAPRTAWLEWRGLTLAPGSYDVVLTTNGGCSTRQPILVGGNHP